MANFKKFDDLHDFNRKMMDDDWNMNQHLVFKLKQSVKGIVGIFNTHILTIIFKFRIFLPP